VLLFAPQDDTQSTRIRVILYASLARARPLKVCLTVNDEAQKQMRDNGWRAISVSQALDLLQETHRAGLVHLAYRVRNAGIHLICSSCCCRHLTTLRRHDYRDAIAESAYTACLDISRCMDGNMCLERCPFGAFSRRGDNELLVSRSPKPPLR